MCWISENIDFSTFLPVIHNHFSGGNLIVCIGNNGQTHLKQNKNNLNS